VHEEQLFGGVPRSTGSEERLGAEQELVEPLTSGGRGEQPQQCCEDGAAPHW
jgi:hypothetical protein